MKHSLEESLRHKLRLDQAYVKMSDFMPLSIKKYIDLSDDEIEHIDQYLYRFAKLQDVLGRRLFKNVLFSLGEDVENKSFIDIFNRLEQLNIITNYDKWLELRLVRNELSHDYDDIPDQNADKINTIYSLKDDLISYLENIVIYLEKRNG